MPVPQKSKAKVKQLKLRLPDRKNLGRWWSGFAQREIF